MSLPLDGGSVALRVPNTKIDSYIRRLQEEKKKRTTIVVIVQNAKGDFGLGQQNTPELNWGPIQGRIEPGEGYLQAGYREPHEEAGIEPHMIEFMSPALHTASVRGTSHPGTSEYTEGVWYVCVGIRLRPGFDVSLAALPGQKPELLQWRWFGFVQACEWLLNQPGARLRPNSTMRQKTLGVLIPAMSLMQALPRE